MFFVTLKFAAGKAEAPVLMEGHNAWIKRGFDDGVFLLVGGLQQSAGGGEPSSPTTHRAPIWKFGFGKIRLWQKKWSPPIFRKLRRFASMSASPS